MRSASGSSCTRSLFPFIYNNPYPLLLLSIVFSFRGCYCVDVVVCINKQEPGPGQKPRAKAGARTGAGVEAEVGGGTGGGTGASAWREIGSRAGTPAPARTPVPSSASAQISAPALSIPAPIQLWMIFFYRHQCCHKSLSLPDTFFYIFEVPNFKILLGIPKYSRNLMLTYASRIDLKPIFMH